MKWCHHTAGSTLGSREDREGGPGRGQAAVVMVRQPGSDSKQELQQPLLLHFGLLHLETYREAELGKPDLTHPY